jgi:YD repeat-containing protein
MNTYDALKRPLEIKLPDGNVTSYEYNDINGMVTEKLNKDVRIVSYLDGLSRITRQVQHPDSNSKTEKYCLEMAITYNGNGK